MNKTNSIDVRKSPARISDSGKVRVGNMSPAFPLTLVSGRPIAVDDAGEARISDYCPARSLGNTADDPNVRIAAVCPTLPPVGSK